LQFSCSTNEFSDIQVYWPSQVNELGLLVFALASSSGTQLCFWSPEFGVYWCLCGIAAPSMCIWVVLEIRHTGAQLASLGLINLKFSVVCQSFFAILMLQKLVLVVSRFVFPGHWDFRTWSAGLLPFHALATLPRRTLG